MVVAPISQGGGSCVSIWQTSQRQIDNKFMRSVLKTQSYQKKEVKKRHCLLNCPTRRKRGIK